MVNTPDISEWMDKQQKLIDDIQELDTGEIKQYVEDNNISYSNLEQAQQQFIAEKEYMKVGAITEILHKMDQENEDKDKKHEKDIEEAKTQTKTEQEAKQKRLKDQLNDNNDESPNSILIDWLLDNIKKIQEMQKEILDAKKWWDTIKLEELIKKLLKEKETLKTTVSEEYEEGNIWKLESSLLSFQFGAKETNWVMSLQLHWYRTKLGTRYRLNRTIKRMNKHWKDSDKFMRYFLTKHSLKKWWALKSILHRKGFDIVKWIGFSMNKEDFEKAFFAKSKEFIYDLEEKLKTLGTTDQTSLQALKKQLNYHYENFMVKNYWGYDSNYKNKLT